MAEASQRRTGTVFGRYVLVEPIGAGAMGEVWVAVDPDLDRKLALKLLRRSRSRRDDNPRLLREARAMARLNHPNVAAVHDVGEVDGQVFIAMEFVAGESLAEFIARGPHPWSTVLPLLRQAGAGLAAAHAAGIVHRDLKPANVLIGADGRVRVVDFGLASAERRERPDELGDASQTLPPDRKEAAVGTPAYMAAEQHRGESFDARSDQFAFCVSAFEALYGRRPFPGSHRYAVALAIVEGRLTDVPAEEQAPAWIHRTILRGLSTAPDERFPDMIALLDQLDRDPAQRRNRWIFAGVGLAMVVAMLATWLAWPARPDPCAEVGEPMAATWSPEHRAALEGWLASGPTEPWREAASQRLLEGLDTRANAWMASERTICSDRVAKRATDRLLDERELCLERQRQAIATLTELPERDASERAEVRDHTLAQPYALLRAIGDPRPCAERVDLGDTQTDREQALAISRARIWLAIDLPRAAERELQAFPCPSADADRCAPELASIQARTLARLGDANQARILLERVAAESLHDDPNLAVRAWLELARLDSLDQPDPLDAPPRASEWIAYAEALADDRITPELRIEVALFAARLELDRDRPERAAARLDAALELGARDSLLDPDLEAKLLWTRARAHRQRSDLDAARIDEAEARERLELALGVGHPAIALLDR